MEAETVTFERTRVMPNKFQNQKLWDAIQSIGYRSVSEFCRDFKLNPVYVSSYLREDGIHNPVTKEGNPTEVAEQLMVIFHRMYDDLFNIPCEIDYDSKSERLRRDAEAHVATQASLQCHDTLELFDCVEMQSAVHEAMEQLTPREKNILDARYGLSEAELTLQEIGRRYDLTKTSIARIEAKALRKLRHPSRSEKLLLFTNIETQRENQRLEQIAKRIAVRQREDTVVYEERRTYLREKYRELDRQCVSSNHAVGKLQVIERAVISACDGLAPRKAGSRLMPCMQVHQVVSGALDNCEVTWCTRCGEIIEMFDFLPTTNMRTYEEWLQAHRLGFDIQGYRARIRQAIDYQTELREQAQLKLNRLSEDYPWLSSR